MFAGQRRSSKSQREFRFAARHKSTQLKRLRVCRDQHTLSANFFSPIVSLIVLRNRYSLLAHFRNQRARIVCPARQASHHFRDQSVPPVTSFATLSTPESRHRIAEFAASMIVLQLPRAGQRKIGIHAKLSQSISKSTKHTAEAR